MFFRRAAPKTVTFSQRLDDLRKLGFTVVSRANGASRIGKYGCAVDVAERDAKVDVSDRSGIVMGDELGFLVDGGYQKFFETPTHKRKPALADELKALHAFDAELKEGLGQESYYNDSLGTVSTYYIYDRVANRDHGVPKRAWER